jgi:uncharacterized protein (UPF0335 family)
MKPPMKDDADFRRHNQRVEEQVALFLHQTVTAIEADNVSIAEVREHQKGVLAEAKARGYSVKVIRKIVADRKRHREEVLQEREVLELYERALEQASSNSRDDGSDDLFEDS